MLQTLKTYQVQKSENFNYWLSLTASLKAKIKGHFLHSSVLQLCFLFKQCLTNQVQGLCGEGAYVITNLVQSKIKQCRAELQSSM